ncbi:MAG: CopG family transcriptional regulator [Candidatus Binatia bacterium]
MAPVIGAEEKEFMKAKTKYTNEPLGSIRIIEDFLPPPAELAFSQQSIKVTIALSKASVDFFKKEAKKHGTQYQKMIRRLLDVYATSHN